MSGLAIVGAVLADQAPLPSITAFGYEYVVAANGLFIRADDSRLEACIPIVLADLHGLEPVTPFARLKLPYIPAAFLWAVLKSARAALPSEETYQFHWDEAGGRWRCRKPGQVASAFAVEYTDDGAAVVDLHSHNTMPAFYSDTDDGDEQGLRFYLVVGEIDTSKPKIKARVGVYGHFMVVPATVVFDGLGPFVDLYRSTRESARSRNDANPQPTE
jgi:PRTRC genetic system protein A